MAEHKVSGTALEKLFSSSKEFFELNKKGDSKARAVMEEFTLDLAILIANAVSLLNPEKVILSGGVAESLRNFLDMIQQKAAELTPVPVQIEIGVLGESAAAIGAAAHALKRANVISF